MKKILLLIQSTYLAIGLSAQLNIDSLRNEAVFEKQDSNRLKSLYELARLYRWTIPDSTIYFSMEGIPLARKLQNELTELNFCFSMGEALSGKGNFAFALETQLNGLKLAEKLNLPEKIAWSNAGVGAVYLYSHDYKNALIYFLKTKKLQL